MEEQTQNPPNADTSARLPPGDGPEQMDAEGSSSSSDPTPVQQMSSRGLKRPVVEGGLVLRRATVVAFVSQRKVQNARPKNHLTVNRQGAE